MKGRFQPWLKVAGCISVLLVSGAIAMSISGCRNDKDPLAALAPFPKIDMSNWPVALPPPQDSLSGSLSVDPSATFVERRSGLSAGEVWAYAFHHRISFIDHHFYYQSRMRDAGFRVVKGRNQLEIAALESIDVRWAEQYVSSSGDVLVTLCTLHDPEHHGSRYEVYIEKRNDIPAEMYEQAGIIAEDSTLRKQFNKMLTKDRF
ncbi:hypothetical protein KDL29_09185 [bacterium]|nr:hypothetical protein [bacterium]